MDEVLIARAKLDSLRKHTIPDRCIGLHYVDQYHDVLAQLEKLLNRDLTGYRIPQKEIQPILRGSNYVTGKKVYSDKRYCERSILMLAIDSLLGVVDAHLKERSAIKSAPAGPLELIERLCKRFPAIVHQLKERGRGRVPLVMADEYDVQYLLHALLREHFDDIRDEEYTPSYAASQKRMDFLLKREEIVVETKMTREGLDAKKLGEELVIDIDWYQEHKDCKTLMCLVYDPEGRIKNPMGLIDGLEKRERKIKVRVFIER